MFLLDTDVLIWILRGKQEVVDWVLGVKETKSLGISVISIAEIYKNIFPAELGVTEDLLDQHILFDVDQKIAKTAGLYWQHYRKQLANLSLMDCLIAATAGANDCTLVSLNIRHFPMREIKVVNTLA